MKNSASLFTVLALILAAILFVLLLVYTELTVFLMWLIAWGGATFFLFGIDKMQAKLGNWRIPEQVLLIFILVGGVVGGLLGMIVFWHKIRKPVFWLVIVISSIIQLAVSRWF